MGLAALGPWDHSGVCEQPEESRSLVPSRVLRGKPRCIEGCEGTNLNEVLK